MSEKIERWTYCCDDVQYSRKDKPEAWTTVDKYSGQMFMSYPVFEFVPGTRGEEEPRRYGPFVIDIDTGENATSDAVSIINWFDRVYGVEIEQWQIFLSGKKGVHLILADTILGTEGGHQYLPLAYKRLAKDIEGELGVKLDTSMYNRGTGKPFRQPHVLRVDTQTYKVQVCLDDLMTIGRDDDIYKEMCSEPGKLTAPDNTERNRYLAEKISFYLKEAAEHQENIRTAPPISDDDLERLTCMVPPCITVLSQATSMGTTGATFNEVAMQLTAYAVTRGTTENGFIAGARTFIEGYPSTSLTTIQKRNENCRARFRTMAANGYQFSCGGVKSLGFSGFDCCECKVDMPVVEVIDNIMTFDDLDKEQGMTLQIPDGILDPGGLISIGMAALSAPGMVRIPQYSLPTIFAVLSRAISGKIRCKGKHPNTFAIKIGTTSTGKTDSDHAIRDAFDYDSSFADFFGPTDFASGQAIMRELSERPVSLIMLDEATSLFKKYSTKDPISDGIKKTLLEVYSASGRPWTKVYADGRNKITVDRPCLSLIGNATDEILSEIQENDFVTGLMQRIDFWCYQGDCPQRGIESGENPHMNRFVEGIRALHNWQSIDPFKGAKIPDIGLDEKGSELLAAYSHQITDEQNRANNGGDKGILARKFDLAIKYGMIHMASARMATELTEPMTEDDLNYGIEVSRMLAAWKVGALKGQLITGDFHQKCVMFTDAVRAAISAKLKPTRSVLINRRMGMKNWSDRVWDEVVSTLVSRGEVRVDRSRRKELYQLIKSNFTDK